MMFAVLETFPDGVALAAPQVYVSIRLIVIKDPKRIVAINPKIIEFSKEKDLDQEGCLSIPNTYEQVERSTSIVVEYYNERGEKITRSCSGSLARAFQHEVDHLDGVLFIDKIHKNDPSNFVAV
jgi:peptide deformylase